MRLIQLRANHSSFKPIRFNRTGLSLIIAEQEGDKTRNKDTYNGVGKSLLFSILHFCLGSNKNKGFAVHLEDWIFFLTVEIRGTEHTIARHASNSSEIYLDEVKLTLTDLKTFLEERCFEIPSGANQLAFRSLISRFIRRGTEAYSDFRIADQGDSKKPYAQMIRTAFLLGMDIPLAVTKHDLRTRKLSLEETMRKVEKDPLFAELVADETVEIELSALRSEAELLSVDLASFKVADDYHEIELEGDAIKRRLDAARRSSVKTGNAIRQIEASLALKSDLDPSRVFQLYNEANSALPDQVEKTIEEVLAFQSSLQSKRSFRLNQERQRLEKELQSAKKAIARLSSELDEKLQFLAGHRALEEYVAVSKKLSDLHVRTAKVEESRDLRERVDREMKVIEHELAGSHLKTDDYLEFADPIIKEASVSFTNKVRALYGSRKSGLTVSNDAGSNQTRYRIDAHIAGDSSEGINEAKIFCFDLTILELQRGHSVNFLAHDSTMFSSIDPRQRLTMFQLAKQLCEERGFQYIAAMNSHDVASIELEVPSAADVFEELFGEESVVLRLTDKSADSKLLGVEIDMKHS